MKLVAAEHLFGGDRIIFYFVSESRVDFRALVRDLAHEFQTRIEMRQIGVRDEARLLGDYERCGRPLCCRAWIKELEPVSMKMAKVQKATLDPTKISGRCGRLMCCLRFEHETYRELSQEPAAQEHPGRHAGRSRQGRRPGRHLAGGGRAPPDGDADQRAGGIADGGRRCAGRGPGRSPPRQRSRATCRWSRAARVRRSAASAAAARAAGRRGARGDRGAAAVAARRGPAPSQCARSRSRKVPAGSRAGSRAGRRDRTGGAVAAAAAAAAVTAAVRRTAAPAQRRGRAVRVRRRRRRRRQPSGGRQFLASR